MTEKPSEKLVRRVAERLPRRAMMHGVSAASAAAVLTGMAARARAADAGPFPAHPKWRFVFVNHVTTNPFFVPTQYGIQDACALLGCTYQWTGSEISDVAQMVNAMNAAIAARADGIAVAIVDPKGFDKPTARALDAGIPVFSYNADAPRGSANRRLAYIGQDLYLSGYQMGERIVKLVGSGEVALFIATPGQLNIQPRINGAADAIKKSGASITYHEIASGPTVNGELSTIKAYYLGHKNVKGLFAVDAGSTESIGEAMRLYGLAKKGVKAGGFDLLPNSLKAVHDGYLDFIIDQQPYLQGFYTVMELFMYKASGGLVGPADINTGLKFVTKEAVKPYLVTKTRYEGSSSAAQILKRSGPIAG
ncbi:MAG: sugar ABC transporter substrate-binding protein [Rhodospirillales bacterium]|jgi:simple sugar transport system substrate-binding protein|nr:sugar ABC transporter substrate-binding protein [Rhodospirillales bacterium]